MANFSIIDSVKCVRNWVKGLSDANPTIETTIEITIDKEKEYSAMIENEKYIFNIYVGEPNFAPYRSVALQIVSLLSDERDLAYAWYDSEDDEEKEILEHLNEGFLLIQSK